MVRKAIKAKRERGERHAGLVIKTEEPARESSPVPAVNDELDDSRWVSNFKRKNYQIIKMMQYFTTIYFRLKKCLVFFQNLDWRTLSRCLQLLTRNFWVYIRAQQCTKTVK